MPGQTAKQPGFGVYVHVPYCRQICPYCDFSKYELGSTLPPEDYASLVRAEIRDRAGTVPFRAMSAVYFGGGTPSAIEPALILSILDELANVGFSKRPSCEMTIEIDPETIDESRLDAYRAMGFNRFSVGVQSFNDRLLKIAGRRHDGKGAARALDLLSTCGLNYSFDLLFALPTQTLAELALDVRTALRFNPSHLSAYCLTVPEGHPMQRGRAPEDEQIEMFGLIERELAAAGLERYEISNFARNGLESRHNLLYWTDSPYWGLGVSAHSFLPRAPHGMRFWNPPTMGAYAKQIQGRRPLPASQVEALETHQALTDYCHTSLRLSVGMAEDALRLKFGSAVADQVESRLDSGLRKGWLQAEGGRWRLSTQGKLLSNQAFELLTFLRDEVSLG